MWWLDGKLHREDGPAIIYLSGEKRWFLNHIEYSEEEFNQKMNIQTCHNKIVEIDGIQYQLKEV